MWAFNEFALLNSVLSFVEENYIVYLNFFIPQMVLSIYSHSGYNLKLISDFNASLCYQKQLLVCWQRLMYDCRCKRP